MKGELTPEQQLTVLGRIWGNDRDGYVFLPVIDGKARSTKERRQGYHEGRAFAWPKDKAKILDRLKAHTEDDVYFTPALFNAKRRSEHVVEAERSLWADLDPVDPNSIERYRPTIAWETSPGRYQAVWLLDRPRIGASWASKENHRLSLHLGADPSGWDSTQLLRIPGRPNHKFDYGDRAVPGVLLWDNGPRYQWEDFDDLPEVGVLHEDVELLDEDLLAGIDRHEVWTRVRLKVSRNVRQYLAQRLIPEDVDRSSVLWEIERELADAGCSVAEIVAVVRPSVWNKYEGRQDELRRLKTEAAKAVSLREDRPLEQVDEEPKPEDLHTLGELGRQGVPRPRWMVQGIWTEGACGFIAGAPKSYKSYLAIDLAISTATGSSWLGLPRHGVRRSRAVLYIQEEDDLRLVLKRMHEVLEARKPERHWNGYLSLGAVGDSDPTLASSARGQHESVAWHPPEGGDPPIYVEVQSGFVASDPNWQTWLEEKIERWDVGLVVIDTLGTTAGDLDTDRAPELMAKLLKPLKIIAQKTGAAMCLVHHNRKGQAGQLGGRAGSEMLGSVALHAWVDCGIYSRVKDQAEADGSRVVDIIREAKLDQELRMRISIPKMFEDVPSGRRQLWEPELVVEQEETHTTEGPPASRKETKGRSAYETKLTGVGLGRGPCPKDRVRVAVGGPTYERLVQRGILMEEGERVRWVRG